MTDSKPVNEQVAPPDNPEPDESRFPKFSLADMIWMVVWVAGAITFCNSAVGSHLTNDPRSAAMILFCLTVVPTILFYFCIRTTKGFWLVLVVTLGLFAGAIILTTIFNWYSVAFLGGLLLMYFLIKSFVAIKSGFGLTIRLTAILLFISIFTGMYLDAKFPSARLKDLLRAREEFPIVDLAPRIRDRSNSSGEVNYAPGNVETDPMARLNHTYNDAYVGRVDSLERFHSKQTEGFIRAIGFGVARMVPLNAENARLDPLDDIPFEESLPNEEEESVFTGVLNEYSLYISDPAFELLKDSKIESGGTDVLVRSYVDFLHPATFGYGPVRMQRAGFEPHAFRHPFPNWEQESELFELKRLELVSLQRGDNPRVYVLDHLPRMDQLSGDTAATRELNEFESSALAELIAGELIVVDRTGSEIQMLGGILAIDKCGDCHTCKPNELLGAFSYTFSTKD